MKIITHDGMFHADELLASALIMHVHGSMQVVRTRELTIVELDDTEIWVLDVGGEYIPRDKNFDHHQNSNLPATNILVLEYMLAQEHISKELFSELVSIFTVVSDIDTRGYEEFNGFQFNSLIRMFNHIEDGWDKAMLVARSIIESAISTVNAVEESRNIWSRGTIVFPGVKVCDAFPIHWKRYKEESFLIHSEGELWKVHSINSKEYPLVSTGKEKFFHVGKFLAIYTNYDDALEAVKQVVI
jgi:hypothetical protein